MTIWGNCDKNVVDIWVVIYRCSHMIILRLTYDCYFLLTYDCKYMIIRTHQILLLLFWYMSVRIWLLIYKYDHMCVIICEHRWFSYMMLTYEHVPHSYTVSRCDVVQFLLTKLDEVRVLSVDVTPHRNADVLLFIERILQKIDDFLGM